jgi:hypothetical protein
MRLLHLWSERKVKNERNSILNLIPTLRCQYASAGAPRPDWSTTESRRVRLNRGPRRLHGQNAFTGTIDSQLPLPWTPDQSSASMPVFRFIPSCNSSSANTGHSNAPSYTYHNMDSFSNGAGTSNAGHDHTDYSVPEETRSVFQNGILHNPLIASTLPEEIHECAKVIRFEGSNEPSIPINWRFAESISALKGLEAAVVNVLIMKKYGVEPQEAVINT